MPSRRQLCAIVAGAAATGLAGCGAVSAPGSTDGARRVELEVTIEGPDGTAVLFETDDIATVGDPDSHPQGGSVVPITLTDDGTESFVDGFTAVGAVEAPEEARITHRTTGEVELEETFAVAPGLADAVGAGDFEGAFTLMVDDRETAETIAEGLAG